MPQIKISLDEEIITFLSDYSRLGYSSKSEIVQAAVLEFKKSLEAKQLMESTEIYQEIYDNDP
ncbi:MAG: hypothetical protein AAFY16_13305 [Cyanobacteria bacterium J06642_3]